MRIKVVGTGRAGSAGRLLADTGPQVLVSFSPDRQARQARGRLSRPSGWTGRASDSRSTRGGVSRGTMMSAWASATQDPHGPHAHSAHLRSADR
jgi:hypothetical protein